MQKQICSEVFNRRQAAEYIGVSNKTLSEILAKGEVVYRRCGKRWLIAKVALDNWLMHKA